VCSSDLPFNLIPKFTFKIRKTRLPIEKHPILKEEVDLMIEKHAIEEVDPVTPGFYSTFFLVPKKDGGQRPVLNLKGLNQYLDVKTFKMQTPQMVINQLHQGDWLASLDLKDAYFHVPVFYKHRPFLRFEFLGRVFQFRVLPFGLATAPRVFTKVLAPIIGILHQMGVYVYPYLDDCLIAAKSLDQLNRSVQLCLSVLDSAGFLINYKKSHLQPVQRIQFLGMELDSRQAMAFLPEGKAQHVVECLKHFSRVGEYKPVKLWLRLLGLMAATLLMVPYARLYMRPVQLYLNSQWRASTLDFSYPVLVPLRLIPIFRWWGDLDNLTQGLVWSQPKPAVMMTTDASEKAWGAHMQGMKVQGPWTTHQKTQHINILELLAVQKGLKVFLDKVRNKSVLVQTDNTTVLHYINKLGGTKSPQLCQITWEMLNWCIDHRIQLQAVHIPGVHNVLADTLSRRLVPHTEWELNDYVVQQLFHIWTEPSVDLFATVKNKKLKRFCSLAPHPQAEYQDALQMSWKNLYAYAFPPLSILNLVLQKVESDKGVLLLVAPGWTRREWYPRLLRLSIHTPYRLPVMKDIVTQQDGTLLHPNPGEFNLVAWLISGEPSLQKAFHDELSARAWPPRVNQLKRTTSLAGTISVDGVNSVISIPMNHLWLT
jgi:hypothetical protein